MEFFFQAGGKAILGTQTRKPDLAINKGTLPSAEKQKALENIQRIKQDLQKGQPRSWRCFHCSDNAYPEQATQPNKKEVPSSGKSAIQKGDYSLMQLSTALFQNTPSSRDDDQLVKQAYSLMQNKRWGEARKIIQNGLQTCNRKDRLCELIANIYLNEKNPLAIGWYMQSCVIGSPSWVPYLMVSYAARALGLDDIAWRCLNACDVIDTGMKRIDNLEIDIADLVRNSNRSEIISSLINFERILDPYLPAANEIPHDQSEREIFTSLNLTGDPEKPPLKQMLRLMRRR
ncbi:MAG: hypothetical protein A2X92_04275 [Syntrophus sp. GWC2_56_31]|nr:MAG: hypothetical protein A2X92_04275 [Syntrophus sp. GWC2_56_31]